MATDLEEEEAYAEQIILPVCEGMVKRLHKAAPETSYSGATFFGKEEVGKK